MRALVDSMLPSFLKMENISMAREVVFCCVGGYSETNIGQKLIFKSKLDKIANMSKMLIFQALR